MYKEIHGKSDGGMSLVYKSFCLFCHVYDIQTWPGLLSLGVCSELIEHLVQSEPALHLKILDATATHIHNDKTKWTEFLRPSLSDQNALISLQNKRFTFYQVWVSGRFCSSRSCIKVDSAFFLVLTNIWCFFLLTGIKPESVSRSTT